MTPKNTIDQFFESLPVSEITGRDIDAGMECCLQLLKTVSHSFDETIYLIDFHHSCFRFVSNKGIFLCGRSPGEVLQLGYDFYPEVVHPKDFEMVTKIHQVVEDYFSHPDTPIRDLAFIVFDFRIRGYKGKLMLNQKVMPLVVNNQVRMALCVVSRSVSKKSGNLFAYFNGQEDSCFQYSFENNLWKREGLIELTPKEWEILNLLKQGMPGKEIADIIGISEKDLRNTQTVIHRKMNVSSKIEAVIFANNHRVVVNSDQPFDQKMSKKLPEKKPRRNMTKEKLKRIQEDMNIGESNNSIAKRENVGEYTIRYHKSIGNLKMPQEIRELMKSSSGIK